jgi:hypothetical protein
MAKETKYVSTKSDKNEDSFSQLNEKLSQDFLKSVQLVTTKALFTDGWFDLSPHFTRIGMQKLALLLSICSQVYLTLRFFPLNPPCHLFPPRLLPSSARVASYIFTTSFTCTHSLTHSLAQHKYTHTRARMHLNSLRERC